MAVQARAIRAAGLEVVCATDHNTIEGALRLRELADGFRVIVGEEISTRDGEIIGLFLERPIARGLSAEETIERIREQGGIVSMPHPFSRDRLNHIHRDALERIASNIDCLEVFNARALFAADNRRAADFARERRIPGAAGSDAHRPWELGRAWLEVDAFEGRDDFLAALRTGTVHGRLAGPGIRVLTRYDKMLKWLGARRRTPGR